LAPTAASQLAVASIADRNACFLDRAGRLRGIGGMSGPAPRSAGAGRAPKTASQIERRHGCAGAPRALGGGGHSRPPWQFGTMRPMPAANIILIGFRGAGKSTVGRLLARRLGRCFVETDDMVTGRQGRSIPEIFRLDGEECFR